MPDLEFDPTRYRKRVIDATVEKHLKAFGAIEIAGTMWSGKTWTALAHSRSNVALDSPQSRELAEIGLFVTSSG